MLRNIKCELMVEVVMINESNLLTCDNNAFCLNLVNIIKTTLWVFFDIEII